jgi:katanin p80 WD40 repeat-containing subunit B1
MAGVRALEFHPYGDYFASGSEDGHVRLWDLRHRSPYQSYASGHAQPVRNILFSPHGQWLLSCSEDGKAIVRNNGKD